MREDEGAESQSERRCESPSEEEPVPDVETRAAVIQRWIGWKTACPRSVAIRVAQRVKPEDREIRAHSHVHIRHELVLLEDAFGLVLIDPPSRATQRANRTRGERSRKWRIDVVGEELVKPAGIQVSKGKLRGFRKLMFDANCSLQNVWSAQVGVDTIDVRRHASESRKGTRDIVRTERRRIDDVGLLRASVQPLSLQDEILREAVVEDAVAGAQYRFGSRTFSSESPGNADSRREIAVIVDRALSLIAQAITQRQIRPRFPIVFGIHTQIEESVRDQRLAGGDRKLVRLIVHECRQGRISKRAVEVRSQQVRSLRNAQPAAEAHRVIPGDVRGV